jgi:hypothetical protein
MDSFYEAPPIARVFAAQLPGELRLSGGSYFDADFGG